MTGLAWRVTLLSLAALGSLAANPLFIDDAARKAAIVAEDVKIVAGEKSSEVTGVYRFRLLPDEWRDVPDDHVTIALPVLVPLKGDAESEVRPVLKTAGRVFQPEGEDVGRGDAPEIRPPRGSSLRMFYFNVPMRYVRSNFDVEIHYTQPHLGGEVVSYLPVKPPVKSEATARITIVSVPGWNLIPPKGPQLEKISPREIVVRPEDKKLIAVRVRKDR